MMKNNYKFVSLGSSCVIKYNLDLYFEKEPTLFFDWLITDMTTVNEIFNCRDINELINENSIKRIGGDSYKNQSKVSITSLPKCVSIHDLPLKYTDVDISNFVEKYKRRYSRIIDLIKNSDKKFFFLIKGEFANFEIDLFNENIKKINSDCNFRLVVIGYNNFEKKENLLTLNLNKYEIKNKQINLKDYWKGELWDWKEIFNYLLTKC